MNEPTYTYIKGQGWVIRNPVFTTLDNKTIMLVERMPRDGEAFWRFNKNYDSSWFQYGGAIDLEKIMNESKKYKLDNFSKWHQGRVVNTICVYVTLEVI